MLFTNEYKMCLFLFSYGRSGNHTMPRIAVENCLNVTHWLLQGIRELPKYTVKQLLKSHSMAYS